MTCHTHTKQRYAFFMSLLLEHPGGRSPILSVQSNSKGWNQESEYSQQIETLKYSQRASGIKDSPDQIQIPQKTYYFVIYLPSASVLRGNSLAELKFEAVLSQQLIKIWISHPHWCVLNFQARENGFPMTWSFVEWILEDPLAAKIHRQ